MKSKNGNSKKGPSWTPASSPHILALQHKMQRGLDLVIKSEMGIAKEDQDKYGDIASVIYSILVQDPTRQGQTINLVGRALYNLGYQRALADKDETNQKQ